MRISFDYIWPRVKDIDEHYSIHPDSVRFVIEKGQPLQSEPTILELGVCHGRTFAALTILAMHNNGNCYGIDHFGLEGSPTEIEENMKSRNLDHWTLIVSDTKTARWNKPIDLLVVDAGHDPANVIPDVEKYVPFVVPNGYVFFDDYEQEDNPQSQHWAVRAYANKACRNDDWTDLGFADRMQGFRRIK